MRGTVNLISRTIALTVVFIIGFMTLAGFMVGGGYLTYTKITIEALQELGVDIQTEEYFDDSGEVYVPQMTLQNLVGEMQMLHSMKDTVSITMLIQRYGLKVEDDLSPYLGQKYRDMPLVKLLSQETVDEILNTTMVGDLYGYEKRENPEYIEGDDFSYPYLWKDDGVELTGLSAIIACYTVKELVTMTPDELTDNIHIYEALSLTSHDDSLVYIVDGEDRILVEDMAEPIVVWTDEYGMPVSGIINAIAEYKISEVEQRINELAIGDITSMVEYNGAWYSWSYDYQTHDVLLTERNDISAELAHITLDEVTGGGLSDAVKDISVSSVLGYTEGSDGKWYTTDANGGTQEVTGVMAVMAGYKVGELDTKIGNVKMGEIAGYEYSEKYEIWCEDATAEPVVPATGILASLSDLTVDEMSDEEILSAKIQTVSISDIMGYEKDENGAWCTVSEDGTKTEVTGIMSVIADSSISNAEQTIDNAEMHKVLGYKEKVDSDGNTILDSNNNVVYVDEDGNDVHVLMQKIARTKFSEIDTITDSLCVADLIPEDQRNSGYISMISENTTLDQLPAAVDNVLQTATVYSFIEKGVIEFSEEDAAVVESAFGPDGTYENYTVPQLIFMMAQMAQ